MPYKFHHIPIKEQMTHIFYHKRICDDTLPASRHLQWDTFRTDACGVYRGLYCVSRIRRAVAYHAEVLGVDDFQGQHKLGHDIVDSAPYEKEQCEQRRIAKEAYHACSSSPLLDSNGLLAQVQKLIRDTREANLSLARNSGVQRQRLWRVNGAKLS